MLSDSSLHVFVKARPLSQGGASSNGLWAAFAAVGVAFLIGCSFHHALVNGLIGRGDARAVFQIAPYNEIPWLDLAWAFRFPGSNEQLYQPITEASFVLDAKIAGELSSRAFQAHLTNVTLHVINSIILFAIVLRASRSILFSSLLSLLYGLHPVQVEPVVWITQRPVLLATLFALLGLWTYLKRPVRHPILRGVVLIFLYVLSLLSGPAWFVLPFVLMLLDIWPLHKNIWRPLSEKIPLLLVMGGYAVYFIFFYLLHASFAVSWTPASLPSFASLILRIVWPAGLSPYRPAQTLPGGFVLALAAGLLLAITLYWSCRRQRTLFVGLTTFCLLLIPQLMFSPDARLQISDTALYVVAPLLVVLAAFKWGPGFVQPLSRRSRIACWISAGLIAVFSVKTFEQTLRWENERSLFAHTTELFPQWSFGYIGLVEADISDNELDAALVHAKKAVSFDPDQASTQFYLGTVLLLQDDSRSAEAIEPLKKALATNPNWPECLQNLGVALARAGRVKESIDYFEKAGQLDPQSPGIHLGLGNAYLEVERFASARSEFQKALEYRNDASAHLGLAAAWAANDMPEMALRHLSTAVAKNPNAAWKASNNRFLKKYRDEPGFRELLDVENRPVDAHLLPPEIPAARTIRRS